MGLGLSCAAFFLRMSVYSFPVVAVGIEGLSFSRSRSREVFVNFSAHFEPGKTLLLGPNGAGKTTLIEILATVLRAQRGDISLVSSKGSISIKNDVRRYRQAVAWMPQHFSPVRGLTVEEHVQYVAWLHGAQSQETKPRATHACDLVGLEGMKTAPVTALSGGQKQRLGLAGVLATGADVLLLDEPTVALDPASRERFMEILRELPEDKTVILSTHQTDDVAQTFDHVAVLQSGNLQFQGNIHEFLQRGRVASEPELTVKNAHAEDIGRSYAAIIQREL